MKILFITQYFHPEPYFLGLPFAKELVRRGHSVEILTGFPCYPQGKLYDGYKIKFIYREIIEGIPVIRLPLYPSHDRSFLRRMMYYSTLSLSLSAIGPWIAKKADVAFVSQGPATLGLPAMIFKWFRRVPFVYNIQDMWPDAVANFGCNKPAIWLLDRFCRYFYRSADRVVAQSPGIQRELCRRGVSSDKIEFIYNWCDETQIKPASYDPALAEKMKMKGKFNILHAGAMGKVQGLSSVIDAANILKDKRPEIQFVFIGGGIERKNLEKKATDLQLKNVIFHDRVPPSEIGKIMALADVMLVHITDTFLHSIAIPSKIQAYLAVGKPIMAGVRGDAADLVIKANAGLQCQPENSEAIAATSEQFYNTPKDSLRQMGENAAIFYKSHLSLSIAAQKYVQVFEQFKRKS